jgi:hypothetical protein
MEKVFARLLLLCAVFVFLAAIFYFVRGCLSRRKEMRFPERRFQLPSLILFGFCHIEDDINNKKISPFRISEVNLRVFG